jgi:signal peptidase I
MAVAVQFGITAYPQWALSALWGTLLYQQTPPALRGKVGVAALLLTVGAMAAVSLLEQRQPGLYPRIAFWTIPSDSMLPTIKIDDVVVSDPLAVALGELRRGDIVVHRSSHGHMLVHRIIGLPGDRVLYRDSRLSLNGSEVPRTDLGEHSTDKHVERPARIIRETIGGQSYLTLDLAQNTWTDNTGELVVPAGHLFLLGDNRDESFDSRLSQQRRGLGMVPFEAVVGRVYHRFSPDPGPLK